MWNSVTDGISEGSDVTQTDGNEGSNVNHAD